MARAFILLLDSMGIGASADADKFGDIGANTLLHIAETCFNNQADIPNERSGALKLPNLSRLGMHLAVKNSCGQEMPACDYNIKPQGMFGYAEEKSRGKDTPSGHWEITGVPVDFDWGYFPTTVPSFPQELVDKFIQQANISGILGNCHASGTEIIKEFGDEHVKTGKPICYTSADSVFQIAVHEESFGLDNLYKLCEIAYDLVKPYNIGRIIARPFNGTSGNYKRTHNRRDFSVKPPRKTLLDYLVEAGGNVIGIGKISDIFAGQGISQKVVAHGNDELFAKTLESAKTAPENSLIFTNFVDFDMQYGHRRDIAGYALALEKLDAQLPQLEQILRPDDVVIITADHGCDPTFKGTDHTREHIPVVVFGPKITAKNLGKRETFADIGQSLATLFNLKPLSNGESFL